MKFTMALLAIPDSSENSGFRFDLCSPCDVFIKGTDTIKLEEVEVEVNTYEYDHEDLRKKAVKTLKERQQIVMAEAVNTCNRLQEIVDKLTPIEYKPDEVVVDHVADDPLAHPFDDDIPF